MEVAHRHTSSHSRPTPALPQIRTTLQIADKLITPGGLLFHHRSRPPGLRPSHVRGISEDMDSRRHPSSFQQLEKVRSNLARLCV